MEQKKTVLLVMGSVRAGRNCPKITSWVGSIGRTTSNYSYEMIDLAKWPLPMDDEPGIPALTGYSQPHTQAWSEKIKSASGVVFVTPQFNWGYPAVLKNAIDHLYHEWRDKPVMIVTYGGHGGGRCAKQLRRVAVRLRMRIVPTSPALRLSDAVIREGAELDPDHDFRHFASQVQRALSELADQIEGHESVLARMRRNWKATLAVLS
ncbi:NAD(P)H-dependent oxidoreductase [Paenibacillus rhizovicinus]|uniref:NAD(P)H-dependent oxidoreductase n=1 Tax=Paenibacillus rhizovicinus TaxID=2704463 RepID=A0A6C0NZP7_9BACL|nr:NADPH-dependent FMN reductase [Paenibacillus rhizovicinus]QHW31416.1 NAD(P)H-dependent oxidoreductase [Paenibacillus rhizovicinus]